MHSSSQCQTPIAKQPNIYLHKNPSFFDNHYLYELLKLFQEITNNNVTDFGNR